MNPSQRSALINQAPSGGGVRAGRSRRPGFCSLGAASRAESRVPKLLFWLPCLSEQVTEPSEPLPLAPKCEGDSITLQCW